MRWFRNTLTGALALAAWLFIADLWWSAARNDWQVLLFFNRNHEAVVEGVIIPLVIAVILLNIMLDLRSLGKRE